MIVIAKEYLGSWKVSTLMGQYGLALGEARLLKLREEITIDDSLGERMKTDGLVNEVQWSDEPIDIDEVDEDAI